MQLNGNHHQWLSLDLHMSSSVPHPTSRFAASLSGVLSQQKSTRNAAVVQAVFVPFISELVICSTSDTDTSHFDHMVVGKEKSRWFDFTLSDNGFVTVTFIADSNEEVGECAEHNNTAITPVS